jgi:hypothetical protein
MILNAYAVLLAFVAAVRLPLGVVILGLGVLAWRPGAHAGPDGGAAADDRSYLVFLLAVVLVGLEVASWPLLYLLLQSYVPEWPGVMCIYGVTQVGKDSLGPSRFLPDLLWFLQVGKPTLVFAGGAWFVLYLLNRRTRTAPLLGRLFLVLLPLGALAAADAAAELAYVGIPKKEEFPPGGCCVGDLEGAAGQTEPLGDWGEAWRGRLYTAYYGGNLALVLALLAASRPGRPAPGAAGLAALLFGGAAVLVASGLFLVQVAAPALLRLPYHHCPYDLIPKAPEAIVAVTLFIGGCLFLGWAGVARWLGRVPETEPFLPAAVRGLLRLSLWCYLASLAMLSLELLLA